MDDPRLRTLIAVTAMPVNEITAACHDLEQVRQQLAVAAANGPDQELVRSMQLIQYAQHLTSEALVAVQRAEAHARTYTESADEPRA